MKKFLTFLSYCFIAKIAASTVENKISGEKFEDFKAKLQEPDADIDKLVFLAMSQRRLPDVEYLIDEGYISKESVDSRDLLGMAVAFGFNEAVKLLLVKDFDPNKNASLVSAVVINNEEAVRLLLDAGGNPDIQDEMGATPLLKAVEQRHCNLIKLLLSHGADAALPDLAGTTPLICAVGENNRQVIGLLLASGTDLNINAEDKYGYSALALACLNLNLDTVKRILELGADPNHIGNHGKTILYDFLESKAISNCRFETCVDEEENNSSICLAKALGFLDIVKLLIGAGADPELANADGNTSITLIQKNPQIKIIQTIFEIIQNRSS